MKRKLNVRNIIIVVLIVFVVILFICLKDIYSSLKNNEAKELVILDTIKGYDYKLDENDSEYFKELFGELKKNLESDKVNQDEYATSISKMFVTDFYSLKYAINKNDVGGIQFVYTDYQDSFSKKAKDTVYRYVKNNIYGKRDQELPDVLDVTVSSIKQDTYKGEKETDEKAYYVNLKINYVESLGYPEEVDLILIHKDKKLEIVKMD